MAASRFGYRCAFRRRSRSILSRFRRIPGVRPVHKFFRNCTRAIAYARLGWSCYDFDHDHLLELIAFKLRRMTHEFTSNNSSVDPSGTRDKSIKLASRLANRLSRTERNYYSPNYKRHAAKWGPGRSVFTPIPDSKHIEWEIVWDKATAEQQQIVQRESAQAFELDAAMRTRDEKWLFAIMGKYHTHWWD